MFHSNNSSKALLLLCLSFLLCFMETMAYGQRLKNAELCDHMELYIGHPNTTTSNASNRVSVQLLDKEGTGRSVNCYEPQRKYSIHISTGFKDIAGLLFVQSKENRGVFQELPAGLETLLCGDRAVSHYCDVKCNLTKNIHIEYMAPNSFANLEFKYAVVFSYRESVRGNITFSRCTHTTPTGTPSPTKMLPEQGVCYGNEFIQNSTIKAAARKCGSKITKLTPENRTYTDSVTDIKYNCVIADNSTVQRKECSTGCYRSIYTISTRLCCRVKFNSTMSLKFKCFPEGGSDDAVLEKYFDVLHQRKCECFKCSEVCPTPVDQNNDPNGSKEDNDTPVDQNNDPDGSTSSGYSEGPTIAKQ